MLRRALLQKNRDAVSRIANPPAELLQFGLQYFVVGAFDDVGYARLKRGQPGSNRVGNKLDIADTKFAAFAKIRLRLDCRKKPINLIDQFCGKSHANGISHHREKTFASAHVVESLDGRPQS